MPTQTRAKTPARFLRSHIVRARPDFIGAPCPRGQHDGLLWALVVRTIIIYKRAMGFEFFYWDYKETKLSEANIPLERASCCSSCEHEHKRVGQGEFRERAEWGIWPSANDSFMLKFQAMCTNKKILGVIGDPIAHSISPAMHNAALKALRLDTEMEYRAFHVKPAELKFFIQNMREKNFGGINVTVPHKVAVMEYLDEITKFAKLIGAVNTVKNEDGKLVGYNTDGPGFLEAIKHKLNFAPAGKKVVLLGAGGAARAVGMILAENGAAQIVIFDIDEAKTAGLEQQISSNFSSKVIGLPARNKELAGYVADCDLLVNATPIGMHPKENASPLGNLKFTSSTGELPPPPYVYDLVYVPKDTLLIQQARSAGATAVSGLSMLV
jgi:shikimate dehydrogenase